MNEQPRPKDTYPCKLFIQDIISSGVDELEVSELHILLNKSWNSEQDISNLVTKIHFLAYNDVKYRCLVASLYQIRFYLIHGDFFDYYNSVNRLDFYDSVIREYECKD